MSKALLTLLILTDCGYSLAQELNWIRFLRDEDGVAHAGWEVCLQTDREGNIYVIRGAGAGFLSPYFFQAAAASGITPSFSVHIGSYIVKLKPDGTSPRLWLSPMMGFISSCEVTPDGIVALLWNYPAEGGGAIYVKSILDQNLKHINGEWPQALGKLPDIRAVPGPDGTIYVAGLARTDLLHIGSRFVRPPPGPGTNFLYIAQLNLAASTNVPPRVLSEPILFTGDTSTLTFEPDVQSFGVTSFEWRFNAEPVFTNEVPLFTVPNRSAYEGSYSVVVSNSFGSVTNILGYLQVTHQVPHLTAELVESGLSLTWKPSTNTFVAQRAEQIGIWSDLVQTPMTNFIDGFLDLRVPLNQTSAFYRLRRL